MNWLSLALALANLSLSISRMIERRQAEAAGAARVLATQLQGALDAVRKAQAAGRAFDAADRAAPERLRDDDGFRRD